jgi:hypothetical protein
MVLKEDSTFKKLLAVKKSKGLCGRERELIFYRIQFQVRAPAFKSVLVYSLLYLLEAVYEVYRLFVLSCAVLIVN